MSHKDPLNFDRNSLERNTFVISDKKVSGSSLLYWRVKKNLGNKREAIPSIIKKKNTILIALVAHTNPSVIH